MLTLGDFADAVEQRRLDAYAVMLDPHTLQDTQDNVDESVLVELAVDNGMTPPPILVVKTTEGLYVEDGRHRTERARRDGVCVRAVVISSVGNGRFELITP